MFTLHVTFVDVSFISVMYILQDAGVRRHGQSEREANPGPVSYSSPDPAATLRDGLQVVGGLPR